MRLLLFILPPLKPPGSLLARTTRPCLKAHPRPLKAFY